MADRALYRTSLATNLLAAATDVDVDTRRAVAFGSIRGLRALVAKVAANPASIRSLAAEDAVEVLNWLDVDAVVVAAAADKRTTVRNAAARLAPAAVRTASRPKLRPVPKAEPFTDVGVSEGVERMLSGAWPLRPKVKHPGITHVTPEEVVEARKLTAYRWFNSLDAADRAKVVVALGETLLPFWMIQAVLDGACGTLSVPELAAAGADIDEGHLRCALDRSSADIDIQIRAAVAVEPFLLHRLAVHTCTSETVRFLLAHPELHVAMHAARHESLSTAQIRGLLDRAATPAELADILGVAETAAVVEAVAARFSVDIDAVIAVGDTVDLYSSKMHRIAVSQAAQLTMVRFSVFSEVAVWLDGGYASVPTEETALATFELLRSGTWLYENLSVEGVCSALNLSTPAAKAFFVRAAETCLSVAYDALAEKGSARARWVFEQMTAQLGADPDRWAFVVRILFEGDFDGSFMDLLTFVEDLAA